MCECVVKRPGEGSRTHRRGWVVSQASRPKRLLKHHGRSVTCREGMKLPGPPCASSLEAGAPAVLSFVSLRSKFSDVVSPKSRFYETCFFMKCWCFSKVNR